jgi:hypothetical protein
MVLCLRWSCCWTCIINDCIMGALEPLVAFLESKHLVPSCELFPLCTFSFLSTHDPSPLIRSLSSTSSHSHFVLSIISLPCVLDPFHTFFMHTRCSRSSLHMLSILSMWFLCTLDVFNFHYTRSMHVFMHPRYYQSSSLPFYACFYAH